MKLVNTKIKPLIFSVLLLAGSGAQGAITIEIYENTSGGTTFEYSGSLTTAELDGIRLGNYSRATNRYTQFGQSNLAGSSVSIGQNLIGGDSIILNISDATVSGFDFLNASSNFTARFPSVSASSVNFGYRLFQDSGSGIVDIQLPDLNSGTTIVDGLSTDYIDINGSAEFTESLTDFEFEVGDTFTLSHTTNGNTLLTTTVIASPIPEPGVSMLAALSLLGVFFRRNRKTSHCV